MNFIRKARISLIIMLAIMIGLKTSSLAATEGVINVDTVRLRKETSTNSSIVTLLSIDDKVSVEEKVGDWYKITYGKYTGYVKAEYVTTNETVETIQTNEEDTASVAENTSTDVEQNNSSEVNNVEFSSNTDIVVKTEEKLYILPLITSSTIYTIKPETKVIEKQKVNGWSYVQVDDVCGWIRTDKLEEQKVVEATQEPVPEETETKTETTEEATPIATETPKQEKNEVTTYSKAKTKYVNSNSIYVRKEPSTTAGIVTSLTKNSEVTVIGEIDVWYKVKVDGKEGYIAQRLLSDKKVEDTSRSSSSRTENKQTTTKEATTQKQETKTESKTGTTTTTSSSSSKGQEIASYAKQYLGYKYVSGGSSPSTGFDCSGFTTYVFKHFGISISRTSSAQASNGTAVSKDNLQPGDILIFRNSANTAVGHVGIYIGNNKFIHASTPKTGVITSSLSESYYAKRYVGARRVI